MRLGVRLAQLRKERKLSQNAVARELQIRSSCLTDYEQGSRDIPVGLLRQMVELYGASEADIRGCEDVLGKEIIGLDSSGVHRASEALDDLLPQAYEVLRGALGEGDVAAARWIYEMVVGRPRQQIDHGLADETKQIVGKHLQRLIELREDVA